jgi:predicted lysophospholipase L1 biosynthesis ABC-type transport system permease subunit
VAGRAHHGAVESESLGDRLRIGAGSFTVAEVLDYRPDQGTGFVNLAPTALIDYDDVAATQLIQPGSRVTHVALFAGSPSQVQEFRDYLKSHKAAGERLREVEESSRQLNSAIDRASRFLNLASLASVLLAAVAVAMGARRYAQRHIDTVALMKCMGASQGFVLVHIHYRIDAAGHRRGGHGRGARIFRAGGARPAAQGFDSHRAAARLRLRPCPLRW